MQLPKARTTDILEQEAGSELLIYDLRTSRMFQLNETSKIVYKSCGSNSFADLKRQYNYTDNLIHLALCELQKNDLLESDYISPFVGMNRRDAIRQVGLASLFALPVIYTLVVPIAAQAASDSCRLDGSCIPITQNLCAGCAGRAVTFARYQANSNCQGPLIDTPQVINCPASGSSFNSPFTDRIRVSVS